MALHKAPDTGAAGAEALSGLVAACPELIHASRIVVGYSGGLDSTVLLHLLHAACAQGLLHAPLAALHVNHALQATADAWEEHCRKQCEALGVAFSAVRAPVTVLPGASVEEAARERRYAAFARELQAGEVLALAQHGDDQVETVLLRLLRGSGAAGLSAMPPRRACGAGLLVRPLLSSTRESLLGYAQAHGLQWIEDGSNADPRFDRNFLRTTVLPLLYRRWPGLAGVLGRSAELSAEAAGLLDELAEIDLHGMATARTGQFPLEGLNGLGAARKRNLLRYWLQRICSEKAWAAPPHRVLMRILPELVDASADAEPVLAWGEGTQAVELRRHRGMLHAFAPLPRRPAPLQWQTQQPLELPPPLGSLELQGCEGRGLARERITQLQVRFRSGGELVKPAGRPTRPLKKILQDAGVPPWLRERIPLLYAGDELVAVADLLICEGWTSVSSENPCRITWRHADLDCGYPPHLLI